MGKENAAKYMISLTDKIMTSVSYNLRSPYLQHDIVWLTNELKLFGPMLEEKYKCALDKLFVMVRDAVLISNTNSNICFMMVYLIELRASGWKSYAATDSQYQDKISKFLEEYPPDTIGYKAPSKVVIVQGEEQVGSTIIEKLQTENNTSEKDNAGAIKSEAGPCSEMTERQFFDMVTDIGETETDPTKLTGIRKIFWLLRNMP